MILNTSDEAAHRQTVTGWVSSNGRFWGEDERTARWEGCTHIACKCGRPVEKAYILCSRCRDERDTVKWLARVHKPWDGKTPLCDITTDRFFFSEDELWEYCDEQGCSPKAMRLVICDPVFAKQIDAHDYYSDDLPEDGDLPPVIEDAFRALNVLIKNHQEPLSWEPGEYAADVGEL